jgi:hypothetical protein
VSHRKERALGRNLVTSSVLHVFVTGLGNAWQQLANKIQRSRRRFAWALRLVSSFGWLAISDRRNLVHSYRPNLSRLLSDRFRRALYSLIGNTVKLRCGSAAVTADERRWMPLSAVMDGKARLVGRSGSQKTCPSTMWRLPRPRDKRGSAFVSTSVEDEIRHPRPSPEGAGVCF